MNALRPYATSEVTSTALLRASGVSVTLGGHAVLQDVSLTVTPGEVLGLIGPNGAGKSTFVRAATNLVPITQGTIEVAGEPLASLAPRALARLVAVVQQLPEAPATMRVQELVLLGRNPHLGLLARESAHDFAIADAAMRRTGCEAFADRSLGTLSGGERRRAFIARALAQEPRLLLLDEPTANLDVEAQCETFELLRALAADGVGVLVVAHDLTLAAAYCDRLVLLAQGRVVATGTPSEVLTAANVAAVYGDRVAVLNDAQHRVPLVVPAILRHRMTDERDRERATERHEDDTSLETSAQATAQPPAQWQGLFPKRHPLVLLYTGNGKGKTSSALGVTMRAWGRGWKICWLQFIKAKTSHYGETRAAAAMGIEMIPLGDGFTWLSKDIEHDKALAQECWALAREKIASSAFDIVVLDEITYPVTYGWLSVEDVIETLRARPANVHIIMTGRDAHPALIEYADLVTEMTEVKHPYQSGIKAQPGIDF